MHAAQFFKARAEVFALRVGYWEFTSDMPGQAAPDKTFRCLTPEELENLRFFFATDPECTTLPGGKQTKTTYEIDQVCQIDNKPATFHFRLEAADSMRFTSTVSVVVEGVTHSGITAARWLHESCDPSQIPIS